jgi:hypothetical protein
MSIKNVLKVFSKFGYPSEKTMSLMNACGYDHEEFLNDLVNHLGHEKTNEFVEKTLYKLSSSPNEIIIRCNLVYSSSPGSWIDLIIYEFGVDTDEEYSDITISWGWGDSSITHPENGTITTLDDIRSEVDMGDWNEFYDFENEIKGDCYQKIVDNCGFGIWFN